MVCIDSTLINFSDKDLFLSIFEGYNNDFEYTADGVFRRATQPQCPNCGIRMNYNGYNTYCKKGLGNVKIGRYICPCCQESSEEDRNFWERLKTEFFQVLNMIYQRMRAHHVSFQGISSIMELIFPRERTPY